MNMKINCGSLEDKQFVDDILQKGQQIVNEANEIEKQYTEIVLSKI